MFTPKKINVPLSMPPSPTATTKTSCCAFKPTLFSTAPRRTPQEIYFESRGKCCKKLLRFNGYPNKVTEQRDECVRVWNIYTHRFEFKFKFIRLYSHKLFIRSEFSIKISSSSNSTVYSARRIKYENHLHLKLNVSNCIFFHRFYFIQKRDGHETLPQAIL